MNYRDLLRLAALPFTLAVWLAVAPAAYAGEPTQGVGTFTVSFSPVFERMANGNTFLDYTFVENSLGIADGTRIGTGEVVIHADGSLNTSNTGTFTGSIAGVSGTTEMDYRGSGTFALAEGSYTATHGTGGLAGVHVEGTDSGSATGPTTLAGTNSFKVNFGAP